MLQTLFSRNVENEKEEKNSDHEINLVFAGITFLTYSPNDVEQNHEVSPKPYF